jgi:hypothetical protein
MTREDIHEIEIRTRNHTFLASQLYDQLKPLKFGSKNSDALLTARDGIGGWIFAYSLRPWLKLVGDERLVYDIKSSGLELSTPDRRTKAFFRFAQYRPADGALIIPIRFQ